MIRNFRTYDLAVDFHRSARALKLPRYLRDQLQRASSSIVLNLAEGNGKSSPADQARFFEIAMGSTRECQAILDLTLEDEDELVAKLDKLAAFEYQLIKSCRNRGG